MIYFLLCLDWVRWASKRNVVKTAFSFLILEVDSSGDAGIESVWPQIRSLKAFIELTTKLKKVLKWCTTLPPFCVKDFISKVHPCSDVDPGSCQMASDYFFGISTTFRGGIVFKLISYIKSIIIISDSGKVWKSNA